MSDGEQLFLGEVIRRHAGQMPGKLALVDDQGSATYAELALAIDAFAAGLARSGVRPGDRVGFAMQPSIAHVAAIFGCMAAGAIPCLLNIRLTAPELLRFLEPIGAAFVVCDDAWRPLAETLDAPLIFLEGANRYGSLLDRLGPVAIADVAPPPRPADIEIAMIIPTGGTTGLPKGAMLSHRAMFLWCGSAGQSALRTSEDIDLYFAPFFHISLITGAFTHLYYGSTVRVLSRFDPQRILELIAEGGSRLAGTPTTYRALREMPQFAQLDRSGVREAGFGSTAVTSEFVEQLRVDYPNARLRHSYGSTEIGCATMMFHEDILSGRLIGVGRAQPGCRILAVDENLRSVGPGEVGELVVDCPWKTSGYWGREAETRASYTPLGFRTGDLGRIEADGWVTIAGRQKEMIISGGENVFPNEVEAVLASHPAVQDLSIYGANDDHWGERVEAAVVLQPGATLTLEELTAYGRLSLAGYKLPKRLRFIDAIPQTPANKPDRRRLREQADADDKVVSPAV